jgi:hypothetical protein
MSAAAPTSDLSSESACLHRVEHCWNGMRQNESEGLRWRLCVGQSLERWMELRRASQPMESDSDRLAAVASTVSHNAEWVRDHLYWAKACRQYPSLVRLPEVITGEHSLAWETLAWCLRRDRLLQRLTSDASSRTAAALEVRRAESLEQQDSRTQE